MVRVGLGQLRNHSHSSPREFEALRTRLADELSRSGRPFKILFTTEPDPPVQYQLAGTAYLVTADGFDQWELYLRLISGVAEQAWTLWQADRAVRMLRQPRPGGSKIRIQP